MPSLQELFGILVVIFVIWVILKMATVAIKLIFQIIGVLLVIWVFYHVFL